MQVDISGCRWLWWSSPLSGAVAVSPPSPRCPQHLPWADVTATVLSCARLPRMFFFQQRSHMEMCERRRSCSGCCGEIQLRGMDQTKPRVGQSPGKSLSGGTVTCSAPAHCDLGWTSVPLLMGIPHRQHPQCHKRSLSSLCPWSPPRLSLCADESMAHATGVIPELEGILVASGFSGQCEGGDFRICSSPHVPGATRKLLLDPPRGRTSLRTLLASAFDVSNPNTRNSLGRV